MKSSAKVSKSKALNSNIRKQNNTITKECSKLGRNLELTYQKYSNVENDGDEPYDPADPDAIYIHPKKSTATSQHSPLCRRLLRTQLQNVSKPKCKFSKRGDDFKGPAKNIKFTTKNLNIKVSKAKLNSNADQISSTKLNQ